MNKLNEEIMSGAKACGICEEWYNMMKDADKDGLLDMYKRGIDFVIKHSFPENSYLLSHSTDEIRDCTGRRGKRDLCIQWYMPRKDFIRPVFCVYTTYTGQEPSRYLGKRAFKSFYKRV